MPQPPASPPRSFWAALGRVIGAGAMAATFVIVVLIAGLAAMFGAMVAGAAVAAAALRARPEARRAPKGWVAEA